MNKLTDLETALVRFITPGTVLHLTTQCRAATRAVQRVFRGQDLGLTLIMGRIGGGHGADLLASGLIKNVVAGSFGAVSRQYTGRLPQVQNMFESGAVRFQHWSFFSMMQRLMAAAQGLPFAVTHSIAGSTMAALNAEDFVTIADPFGGAQPAYLMKALHPEVSILHAHAADEDGNVILLPPQEEGAWGAKAATRAVIVTAEHIVSREYIRAHSHLVQLPGRYVSAVVHVPHGAHPGPFSSIVLPDLRGYDEDQEFNGAYFAAATGDAAGLERWVEEWIYAPASHQAYLDKLGAGRLERLTPAPAAPAKSDEKSAGTAAPSDKPASDNERIMTLALRHILRRMDSQAYEAFLVGAGLSEVPATAAWVMLEEQGVQVDLVMGHGYYGFQPVSGRSEPDPTTVMNITDAPTIYGTYMAGRPGKMLAMLGAGQVDRFGNMNSTLIKGQILSGSGGSNDAASTCDVLVVTRLSPRKLVDKVDFITCAGTRVQAVVTERGLFEKHDGLLVLTRVLDADELGLSGQIEKIRKSCGWAVELAPQVELEAAPTETELGLIRKLMPSRYD